MRIEILVRPNASKTAVGGSYDGALVIRVVEPADRGKATGAALRALAKSLEVPPRDVRLVRGATSRRKSVEVTGEAEELLQTRLKHLLAAAG